MKRFIFVIVYISIISSIFPDEYVFNSKGQKIILKDNFTWEFVNNEHKENSFRNTQWGMTYQEVIGIETLEITYEGEGFFVCSDKLGDFTADVVYIFAKNILVRSKYIFSHEHSNKTDFISDEPPRVCRRPKSMRGYGHGQRKQVFS